MLGLIRNLLDSLHDGINDMWLSYPLGRYTSNQRLGVPRNKGVGEE